MSKYAHIRLRRGTAQEWASSEPQPEGEILKLGEPGYEKDTGKLKIGDGVTGWNNLPYFADGATLGTFYGSDADSADGNNYDTIKLIPDVNLVQNIGTDQYVIIDPTAPNHIHLRAGGTIDNSNAELIVGGEHSYVKIGAGENPAILISSNNNSWIFSTNGTLELASNGLRFSDNTVQTTAWDGGSTNTFTPSFGGSTSNPNINYAVRYGKYIKIDKLIYFNIRIQNQVKTASGVGDLRIIDLPFISSSTNAGYSTGVVRHTGGVFGDARPATSFYISPNTNYISLMNDGSNISVNNIGSTSEMILSGFYFID